MSPLDWEHHLSNYDIFVELISKLLLKLDKNIVQIDRILFNFPFLSWLYKNVQKYEKILILLLDE